MNLRFIRKALATVSAISIALTAVIIPSAPVVSAEGEWYAPYVDALFDLGIVDSTGNAFNPGDNLTRAALAAMLNRTVGFAVDASEVDDPGFSDVAESDWFYVDVAALENAGVVQGTTPTTFSPGAYVTRAAATKMIGLALDISTSDDDVPFTDVASGDWFNSYVGSLYFNSIVDGVAGSDNFNPAGLVTRAAMAKMLALAIAVSEADEGEYARGEESAFAAYSAAEIVALITGGVVADEGEDVADVASDASFSVGLASDTPMTATIPQNGYNVPYTYLTFTAGPEEGVNVTTLIITRSGLGSTANFSRVKLYEGLTQLSSEKTLSSQYNSANFNLNSSPIVVSAGSSKTVRILGDMTGTTTGVSNQLGIASGNDVTAVGAETGGAVTVGGSFPVYGNLMTTSGATVGTVDISLADPQGATAGEFYIGDQDGIFTRITLSASTEDADLTSIAFRNNGSAGDDEIANVSLYYRGELVAGPVQMVNRYVTLEFAEPLYLEKGSSVTMELRGDIVGGYNKTVGFDIYKLWHINAVGRVYGFPVQITNTDGTATGTIIADDITGSRLSFSTGSKNPTVGDVKPSAKDFVGLQFNIINTGDIVDIQNLVVDLVTTATGGTITPAHVSDIKIWRLDDDFDFLNVVAGPVEPTGATLGGNESLTFADVFEVEANVTAHFAVTYDLANTVTATDDVKVSLSNTKASLEIRNVVTGDTIYNGTTTTTASTYISTAVAGNTRTVAKPSLTFTVANAPSTDAFVKNSTNVPIVAFNAKAGSADDVTLTSTTFTLVSNVGSTVKGYTCGAAAVSSDLRSVKLYADVDGTETLLDGPREISGTTVNFTGFQQEIPAGETIRFLLRADIPSSAATNACPALSIAAPANVTANDSDGRSLASTQVTATTINGTPTAYILAAASGKLQVIVSNNTPNGGQVIAGAEDVPVAKFKFEASTVEDVEIHKLRLYNATASTDSAIERVKLWDGDVLVASGTISSQYVIWESLAITIPRNSSKELTLTITFNDSNTIQDIAGKAPRFVVRNLEDDWVDGGTAGAPDGTVDLIGGTAATTVSKNGDIKVVGKQSGQLLVNVAGTTDAIAGDRGFYAVAKGNYCDSVGFETGAATCDGTVSFSGNTLTESQYVYNTNLTLSLEGGSGGTPVGSQGAATGTEVTLFKFRIAAAANTTAANPKEIILNDLYLTINGDAEADTFKLYGPSSTSTALDTSSVIHRTNIIDETGASAAHHTTRTTVIPFTGLTGQDSKIAYGSSKIYTLKGKVYSITSNDFPTRSLRVSIDSYGTSAGASDVVWLDNGTTTANSNSQAVYWVYEEGVDELLPSSPMTFTGSSYITATTAAPTLDLARSTAAGTLVVYWNLPIDSGTATAADFAVDALTNGSWVDGTAVTVVGNATTATATYLMTTGSTTDDFSMDTDTIKAIGSEATGSNIAFNANASHVKDADITPGF